MLIVDLDPQANASSGLGIDRRGLETSMYQVLMHDVPLENCIEPTDVKGLFVAPATLDLAGAEIELVPGVQPGDPATPCDPHGPRPTTTMCSSTARRRSAC